MWNAEDSYNKHHLRVFVQGPGTADGMKDGHAWTWKYSKKLIKELLEDASVLIKEGIKNIECANKNIELV